MSNYSNLAKPLSGTPLSIVDGAISVLADSGLSNLTTKKVSERAAVSTASIHYFFETKDRLINESFAHVLEGMWARLSRVVDEDLPPMERIRRTLNAFFDEDKNGVETIQIWPQLWHHAGNNHEVGTLFRDYNSRVTNLFQSFLSDAGMTAEKARIHAFRLNALHRGLWIEFKVGGTIQAREVNTIINSIISSLESELAGDLS